ncbi:MAG: hypothetical protein ACE5D7_06875, partial [Fidelibacterota bacterium]
AAASVAGCKKAVENHLVKEKELVVLLITGTGLKDIPAAQQMIKIPSPVEPRTQAVDQYLKSTKPGIFHRESDGEL